MFSAPALQPPVARAQAFASRRVTKVAGRGATAPGADEPLTLDARWSSASSVSAFMSRECVLPAVRCDLCVTVF